ncbi:MAG TPA: hypothetical protein VLX09_06765 [Stellaceae bacterium]|nr:hypothetical protein [Xanthobacteraceae bacterium]HUK07551.1 hypothetical protein [Stellaceae bacterium]
MSYGAPPKMKWAFLVALVAGSSFIWWSCVRLKRVRCEGGNLYFSNYLREIVVPLAAVERVTENRWINIHPVTIFLRRSTDFGDKIMFMPKTRMMLLWRSHPIVAEIQRMADAAAARSAS